MRARDILFFTPSQLDSQLPDRLRLVFEDDVELDTTKKRVIYSSYFWDFHREYPSLKISSKHFVDSVLKGKRLGSSTHMDLIELIYRELCESHNFFTPKEKEKPLAICYQITNKIHNEITKMAEEDVTSIDILDFIEVIDHPVIKHANDSTEARPESIEKTYAIIIDTLNNDSSLDHNSLAAAVRARLVNPNQLMQCVSVRGFTTEVDGHIFSVPVMSNYTKGLRQLYEYAADSRSAAKALYFSEAALQDAEFFARRLQLLTMNIERIDYSDCGSTEHISWKIKPPQTKENGKLVYPGDLVFMVGKYYLDETTGEYKVITGDDPSLYDKTIKFRSVNHCRHPDKHAVCARCFGALSHNVPGTANLGHLCSATMTQQSTQSVLSTKHLDSSASSADIVLDEVTAKFFSTNKEKSALVVNKNFRGKPFSIIVSREDATGLIDILNTPNLDNINPNRVSAVEMLAFKYVDRNVPYENIIITEKANRRPHLSIEFLKYLRDVNPWKIDERNNFIFTFKDWDFTLPFLQFPEVEYSFSDHSKEIEKLIESSAKQMANNEYNESPAVRLQKLFDLVNSKLNVNIACLEVIIEAVKVSGPGEFDLARNSENAVLAVADQVIKNRSLSNAFAYQDRLTTITNPKSFFALDRPDSVFDVFLSPKEVVDQLKTK
jgi:hypothetical protein